jgi:hypothetical protein
MTFYIVYINLTIAINKKEVHVHFLQKIPHATNYLPFFLRVFGMTAMPAC